MKCPQWSMPGLKHFKLLSHSKVSAARPIQPGPSQDNSSEFHSPANSPAQSLNSDFHDVRNEMESSVEVSGKFYSPRPSPVRGLSSGDFSDLDSDEMRTGYYSPIPSPVSSMKVHKDEDGSNNGMISTTDKLMPGLVQGNNSGISGDESTALIKEEGTYVYTRRWYVLFIFSMCALVQGLTFGSYGPIAQSLKAAFGWSKGNIGMLCLWNNLAVVLSALPISKLLDVKGIRYGTIVSMALSTVGLGLRCVSSDPVTATWLNNIAQVLCGVSSVLPYGAVSLLSSLWFPVTQRTTATALSTFAGYAGMGLSFIIGPLIVPEPDLSGSNSSNSTLQWHINGTDVSAEKDAIMLYFYCTAAFSALMLLLVLIYFPEKPPLPPSISAGCQRLEYHQGLKNLLKNKEFLLILFIFSIGTGVYAEFAVILDIDLAPLGVSQKTAGWMGFYALIGGCFAGFVISRIADIFRGKLKLFLILMFLPSTAFFVWFLMMVEGYVDRNIASLYITVVLPGCLITGTQPIFFELACEITYPTGESVATFFMALAQYLTGAFFLAILIIPGIGVGWMNWLVVACTAVTLGLLFLVREDYHRMKIDDTEIDVSPSNSDPGYNAN
ncbi:disrupted in renal carcinoma protein 2 homolog [Plakobranchus ocellatus]|uniref:Disrupted in renal carcinoma protein 2 homolog n=1 Tax=Plakobranchus ocellatus TaxID=259542 RepID=A0AAV4DSF9_9GAST|nr:disrupted in renal carcinoma protein 2 homolog [Plakobranchus ocellatus]